MRVEHCRTRESPSFVLWGSPLFLGTDAPLGAIHRMPPLSTPTPPLTQPRTLSLARSSLTSVPRHVGHSLRDKPGKGRDYYHTCYCLSGLSSSQGLSMAQGAGLGEGELLRQTHPQHNICVDKEEAFRAYFAAIPQ